MEVNVEKEIKSSSVDFSFGEILNLHKVNEIAIQPEYQRLFRWSNEQRSRLIESIIIGLPIPPIFLIETEHGILELIDGLQRTSSVLQFMDETSLGLDKLTLVGCDLIEELNGKAFEDLDTFIRMKIKRTPIRAVIISKSNDDFIKYEMFKRLNTGGSNLSAQEIRNCSARMLTGGREFYEFIQNLCAFPEFKTATSRLPDTTKERRGDEELVLRFFAVKYFVSMFRDNVEEWLNEAMEAILFKDINFDMQIEGKEFKDVITTIVEKLGDGAFTRLNKDDNPTGRLAPAYFEAVTMGVLRNLDAVRLMPEDEVRRRHMELLRDPNFLSNTGPGASSVGKLQGRIEAAVQAFSV